MTDTSCTVSQQERQTVDKLAYVIWRALGAGRHRVTAERCVEAAQAALEYQGHYASPDLWRPIATAPERQWVMIFADGVVGEAMNYDSDGGWWWYGTYGEHWADEIQPPPRLWQPLPEAPSPSNGPNKHLPPETGEPG